MDWGVGLLAFLSLGLGGPFLPLVYHASINLFNRVYMLIKYPDLYIWTAAATGWEGESWKDRWFLGLAFGVSRTVFGYLQLQSCSRRGCIYIYFLPPSLAITLKGCISNQIPVYMPYSYICVEVVVVKGYHMVTEILQMDIRLDFWHSEIIGDLNNHGIIIIIVIYPPSAC